MKKKLLADFLEDLEYSWRTKYATSSGIVRFDPSKQDSDIVILKRVLKNCLKVELTNEKTQSQVKTFENYLIENFSINKKNHPRPYLSKEKINLTDDNIISLSKFNKGFKKILQSQQQKNDSEEIILGRGA
jgi:hypothetical protein